jgi:hypothetical protein
MPGAAAARVRSLLAAAGGGVGRGGCWVDGSGAGSLSAAPPLSPAAWGRAVYACGEYGWGRDWGAAGGGGGGAAPQGLAAGGVAVDAKESSRSLRGRGGETGASGPAFGGKGVRRCSGSGLLRFSWGVSARGSDEEAAPEPRINGAAVAVVVE